MFVGVLCCVRLYLYLTMYVRVLYAHMLYTCLCDCMTVYGYVDILEFFPNPYFSSFLLL